MSARTSGMHVGLVRWVWSVGITTNDVVRASQRKRAHRARGRVKGEQLVYLAGILYYEY